jgi:hypothetical protein
LKDTKANDDGAPTRIALALLDRRLSPGSCRPPLKKVQFVIRNPLVTIFFV